MSNTQGKKKVKNTLQGVAAGTLSQSGGSSPIMVQCSVSLASVLKAAGSHDASNVTVRSVSSSHVASHARADKGPGNPSRDAQVPVNIGGVIHSPQLTNLGRVACSPQPANIGRVAHSPHPETAMLSGLSAQPAGPASPLKPSYSSIAAGAQREINLTSLRHRAHLPMMAVQVAQGLFFEEAEQEELDEAEAAVLVSPEKGGFGYHTSSSQAYRSATMEQPFAESYMQPQPLLYSRTPFAGPQQPFYGQTDNRVVEKITALQGQATESTRIQSLEMHQLIRSLRAMSDGMQGSNHKLDKLIQLTESKRASRSRSSRG